MMEEITAFLITCGENPNYEDCLAALQSQTLACKIDIIANYAPLSRAFQEMLNRVQTPYYVQVDEDMVLLPDALEKMLKAIKESPQNVAMICFPIEEPHAEQLIYGCKIYKTEIFRHYPYNLECISCEIEQIRRLNQDGYINTFADLDQCVAEHSAKWTEELVFERYYDLMDKWKLYHYEWVEKLPGMFARRIPDKINLYALIGALASLFSSEIRNQEKNFLIKSPAYLMARDWMSEPTAATLYLTSKCNYRCEFCRRQREGNDLEEAPDMDLNMMVYLLDRFPSINGICLCGYGEPFLNPEIKPMVRCGIKRNKTIGIITNGSLLYEKAHYFDEMGPSYISVSLNASTPEIHEQRMGIAGMWPRIMKGIEAIQERKIPIYLSFVCSVATLDEVPSFIELANKLNVDGVYLHNLLPHEDQEHFLANVLTVQHKSIVDSWRHSPGAAKVLKWPVLIDLLNPRRGCKLQFNVLHVDGNGSISICNSVYPCRKENGNIRDHSVWHNDYTKRFRSRFAEPELPFECKWCFRNWEI